MCFGKGSQGFLTPGASPRGVFFTPFFPTGGCVANSAFEGFFIRFGWGGGPPPYFWEEFFWCAGTHKGGVSATNNILGGRPHFGGVHPTLV